MIIHSASHIAGKWTFGDSIHKNSICTSEALSQNVPRIIHIKQDLDKLEDRCEKWQVCVNKRIYSMLQEDIDPGWISEIPTVPESVASVLYIQQDTPDNG